ncbi:MAG: hypothetical protein Q8P41_16435 [Pseudomonadota bacterium]|nr:hypothetical protein [Pseudomonadota bacterium]
MGTPVTLTPPADPPVAAVPTVGAPIDAPEPPVELNLPEPPVELDLLEPLVGLLEPPPVPPEPTPCTTWAGTALVLASYLALSVAWTWPLARLDPNVLVTRQFDLYPTIWLLARAHSVGLDLWHAGSGWPVGESLARVDSYAVLPIAWALGRWVDPRVLAALLALLGPVVGALAAERCAGQAFRVPRPASWVAGAIYGFSGITATALLEGHVYHAVNPWLPLLLWSAWRAQDTDGRWLHGFAAAGAWALGMFTTGYAGVLGALLLVVIGLHGGVARLAAGMLFVGLPAGLLYLRLYGAGGGWSDGQEMEASQILSMGSASLASLAGWSDTLDLRYHSIGATVGFAGLWAALLAPFVLRRAWGWRTLLGLALLSLLVALGRTIQVAPGSTPLLSPVAWLVNVPGIEHFRFPIRVTWLYALCVAMVAARVVGAFQARLGPAWIAPLLLLVAGDALIGTGLPWRLRSQIGTIPSAYASAPEGRAILDLWARPLDRSSGELEMWSRALTCYYQAFHARPVLEVCMGTNIDSPREIVDRWLGGRLLAPGTDAGWLAERIGSLGVGAIALHADVYRPADRDVLIDALTATFGAVVADTDDGGERILLWVVPPVTGADPVATWDAIRARR